MVPTHELFKTEIAKLIHAELEKIALELNTPFTNSVQEVFGLLTLPPDFQLGQAALPCFPFAKALKQPPQKIALQLESALSQGQMHLIQNVKATNAYLNFTANFNNLFKDILTQVEKNSTFKQNFPLEKEKIVVEYSQPNTHKAMHVGHLRCLVLGDAVCNLLDYAGHTAVRATYPGDIGTHVAKVVWYLTHPTSKPLPTATEDRASWLGNMYAKADEAFKSFKGTLEEASIKADIAEILRQINTRSGTYFDLWAETREWSLDYLKEIYAWLNSHFHIWYFESECEAPSKALVKQKYEEGFFVKDNGAIGLDLSQWKLGFAMYLKSDGNGLYLTKDLDLISKKFSDPAVTKSIYVVDARQKFHFEQLFKTAELMGYEQAKKSTHLSYETVNTEQGTPFSSRELNGLALLDLKEKMEHKVTTDYLERYRGKWSDEEIMLTARKVTIGALKYGMLRVDNNTQINFSLSEWLRLDGDTGPYLQYVHARCSSILEKLGTSDHHFTPNLVQKEEQELCFFISRFNEFALQAAAQCRPSVIAGFLFDLAKLFNRFYEACSIKDSSGESKDTRLALVFLTKKAIFEGLALLGIPAPERM